MCEQCWVDEGRPSVITPEVRHAAELIEKLYEVHPVGGQLHVVTDDWNIEDSNVRWCLEQRPIDAIERETGEALMELDEYGRGAALALWCGFIGPDAR